MPDSLPFPDGFIWGTATSGHQIEGGNDASNWWAWERERQSPARQQSGRSVDYWNRYEEDHALMARLGYRAFRLGVEWARVEPARGKIDEEALRRYTDILASLRAHGIGICLTLNHWVLPQWVVRQGDWLNPRTLDDLVRFAGVVAERLGEFPDWWITLNEPMVSTMAGNLLAHFPPQRRSWRAFRRTVAAHLEAHARLYELIHRHVPAAPGGGPTQVGVAKAYPWVEPWGSPGLDGLYERVAAKLFRLLSYGAWDRSIMTGRRHVLFGGDVVPELRGSYDFCGINYYTRLSLKRASGPGSRYGVTEKQAPPGIARSDMGWQVYPEGLAAVVRHVWQRFRKPIVITENGIADAADSQRPAYIVRHLAAVHRVLAEGIPVQGYFHWSFVDNFEWREGYSKKFGLVQVDVSDPRLERRPRRSAQLYSEIVRANAITRETVARYTPELQGRLFGEDGV